VEIGPRRVSIVPHTHWDREGYEPFQTLRMRLVHLIDTLLDLLERDPSYAPFHLDGQMAVIDDDLEIRPENEERIRARHWPAPGGSRWGPGTSSWTSSWCRTRQLPGTCRRDCAGVPPSAAPRRWLPAGHVRAHRADGADPVTGRLRTRGGVARGPVGHRPAQAISPTPESPEELNRPRAYAGSGQN
jgi:hypothetical protein